MQKNRDWMALVTHSHPLPVAPSWALDRCYEDDLEEARDGGFVVYPELSGSHSQLDNISSRTLNG